MRKALPSNFQIMAMHKVAPNQNKKAALGTEQLSVIIASLQ